MALTDYAMIYFSTAVVFLIADIVWLGFVAKDFYRQMLAIHLRDRFMMAPAIAFYSVYICGIILFAIMPALRTGKWESAFIFGLLFGFFCYATYDMTNLATLRNWPVAVVIVDIAWGTLLTGVSAVAGFHGGSFFVSSMT